MRVVVIGTGAMGSAACHQLAARGAEVVGVDRFAPPHDRGSSHGESRIIRQAYFEHPSYVPLLRRSYELWADAEREAGRKLYHETGIAYFCPPESPLLAGLRLSSERFSIPLSEPDADARAALAGRFSPPEGFAARWEPRAGYLEVESAVAAQLELAGRAGARLVHDRAVVSWAASSRGVQVLTDQETIEGDALVVTAGAWSGQVLRELGLPLRVLRKTMFWFPAAPAHGEAQGMPCFFFETERGTFYGFPETAPGAGVKVAIHSGGDPVSDPGQVDLGISPADLAPVADLVRRLLPGVGDKPLRAATCLYTMTPDEHFVVDQHPSHPNVFFAAGFSGHGFKFAPVIGEILADLILREETDHSIDFLRIREFPAKEGQK